MVKKIQNFIALFGLLILFAGIFASAITQEVSAFSLAVETGGSIAVPPDMIPKVPPPEEAVFPAPGGNNSNAQEQTALPEEKSLLAGGAESFEQRIQGIEARGKNLETWNSIVTVLFIISLLFNIYFGLKVRYVLRKIGTA